MSTPKTCLTVLLLGLLLASCDLPEIRLPKRTPKTIPAREIVAKKEGLVISDLKWTQLPSTQPTVDFELTVTNEGTLDVSQVDVRFSCEYAGGERDDGGLLMMAMDDASMFPDKLGEGESGRMGGSIAFPRATKETITKVMLEIVEVK